MTHFVSQIVQTWSKVHCRLIDWVLPPTRHWICHFRDVLHSQWLGV